MLICRTPLRISFFGGGTDFPKWYSENKGLVLGTSINKFTYIQARYLPEIFNYKFNFRIRYFRNEERLNHKKIRHPVYRAIINRLKLNNNSIEIIHNSDLPALSGMGSSSSNTVSTLYALHKLINKPISKKKLIDEAINIEQNILKESVGSQDQILCGQGGFNAIYFNNQKYKIKKISSNRNLKALERSIFVVFTGMTRLAEKIERKKLNEMEVKYSIYKELYDIAKDGVNLIESKSFSLKKFGHLLDQSWKAKKHLGKYVSNNHIDQMYEEALKQGAYGGKLLGAGSGGFILLICNKKIKKKLERCFKHYKIIPIKFEREGSKIIYEN